MQELKKYSWVLLTALAFGTMEIALKIGGNVFSAYQLTFLRFLIGGFFLLPFAIHDLRKRGHKMTLGDWGFVLILAFVNIVVSMTLFQMSVMHSNATLSAVLISFNPMFTMIFAHFIASEKFTKMKGLVLFICITGLILVAAPWNLAAGNSVSGILMGLGASIAFGLYTALSKRRIGKLGGMALNSFSFITGALMELVVLLILGEPVISEGYAESIPLLIYVSVVVTGFGYFCFMKAIEKAGASTASYAFFVKPIIAMILAAIILGEVITWNIVLGIVVIVFGCFFNAWYQKRHGVVKVG